MAFASGDMYTVAKVPMTLYWSSDRAAKKNKTGSGTITVAGDYRIDPNAGVYWTNASGAWFEPDKKPASGAIALYALQEAPNGSWYTIGWVREDDNLQGITIHNIPSQISTNDANYKLSLRGTQGIAYKYTAKIGTKVIHEEETTLTYAGTAKTFDLTSTAKNNIYAALGSKSTGTMNITVETKYNNKVIHTSKASITVVIPSGGNPTWVTNPKVEIVGAIGDKAYQNISKIKVTNGTLSYKDGATFKSISITASGYTSSSSPFTTPVINATGNRSVKVVVTDTRNRTVSYDATVNFLAGKGLSVTQFTASRLTNNTVKIDGNGSFTTAIEGTPKYKVERRTRGASTWTEITAATNVTVSGTNFSLTETYATTVFDVKTSYDIRLTIIGSTSSVYVQTVVGTESVPFSFGKHGAGAGVMFNNSNSANLQVGKEGIDSLGPIKVGGVKQGFDNRIIGNLDPSTVTTSGAARIAEGHADLPAGSAYSQLLTIRGGADTIAQMVFPYHNTGNPWVRSGNPPEVGGKGTYGAWKKLAFSEELPTINEQSYYTLFDYPNGVRVMYLRNRIRKDLVPTTRWGSWTFKYPHKFETVEGITFNLMLPQAYRPSFDLSTQLHNVTTEGYSFEVVSMAGVTTPLTNIMVEGHYVSLVVWGTI